MKALLVIVLVMLAACSGPEREAPPAQAPEATVFDPLTSALDRAAGVEDTIREGDAERRRQIDEAQGL